MQESPDDIVLKHTLMNGGDKKKHIIQVPLKNKNWNMKVGILGNSSFANHSDLLNILHHL